MTAIAVGSCSPHFKVLERLGIVDTERYVARTTEVRIRGFRDKAGWIKRHRQCCICHTQQFLNGTVLYDGQQGEGCRTIAFPRFGELTSA